MSAIHIVARGGFNNVRVRILFDLRAFSVVSVVRMLEPGSTQARAIRPRLCAKMLRLISLKCVELCILIL